MFQTARELRESEREQERRALAAQKQREQEAQEERAQADADGRLPGVPESLRSDVQAEASAWLAWLRGC